MDPIFKALNDPNRRALLDALRQRDGQTLQELEEGLEMTRFGVMNHLKVLEAAALIATRKKGRFKHHYLNALPLQEVLDRWIEPFLAKPMARTLLDLKATLEAEPPAVTLASLYIGAPPARAWDALTTADALTRIHAWAETAEGHLTAKGAEMTLAPAGAPPRLILRATALDPPHWLDFDETALPEGTAQRLRLDLTPLPGGHRVRVSHQALPPDQKRAHDDWVRTLSGLKTWLETGHPTRFAPAD